MHSVETIQPNATNAVSAFARQAQFQCLSGSTIALLEGRKLLQLTDNGKWRFGDANNGCSRSFRNRKWKRCDTSGSNWHKLAGLQDVVAKDRKQVAFVLEGSKDALAVAELLNRVGRLVATGIVMALGSGYRPIEAEIASLRGRKVVLVGDADSTGRESVKRVSGALTEHGVDHIVLCWQESAKDAFDLVQMHAAEKANFASLFSSLVQFFSSPSPPSTVQQFNSSTAQQVNSSSQDSLCLQKEKQAEKADFTNSSQEIAELVAPFVVTEPSSGNTWAFELARELVTRDMLSDETIKAAVREWFIRSRPLLPADATEEKTLRKFYNQLRRVRFTTVGLTAAIERARTLPLPDIPGLSENELRVAALHRELQREAGDGPYICPVSVAAKFLEQDWPEQARWVQHKLEKAGVIQCFERGAPHTEGKRGKSTLWRYLKS
jgi:hypothetical protein